MRSLLLITIAFCSALSTDVLAQNIQPLELARKIFETKANFDFTDYISGEYDGKFTGKQLEGATTEFQLLGQNESTAVVAMKIKNEDGTSLDTYLHFQNSTRWRMIALRSLAIPAMMYEVKKEMENLTDSQIDAMIAEGKKLEKPEQAIFTSRDDYYYKLGQMRLTLQSDDSIASHFAANQEAFDRLKEMAIKELGDKSMHEEQSILLLLQSKSEYQRLFINNISTGGWELGTCLNFSIGGMVDNSVGYLYVKDKKDLPPMTPNHIIMIREIAKGWYIYKTT